MVSAADTFAILAAAKRGVKHVSENSAMDDGGTSPFWLRAMATCSAPEKATNSAMVMADADAPSSSVTAGFRGGCGDGGDMDTPTIKFQTAMCAPPAPQSLVALPESGNWCPRPNETTAQSGVMLQLSLAPDLYGVRTSGRMQGGSVMSCGASARSPRQQPHEQLMAVRGGTMNGVGRQGGGGLGSMMGASGAGWHGGPSLEHHAQLSKVEEEEDVEVDDEDEVEGGKEEAEVYEEGHEMLASLPVESLSCNAGSGVDCGKELTEIVTQTANQMTPAAAAPQATTLATSLATMEVTRRAGGSGGNSAADKFQAAGGTEGKKGLSDPNLGMQGLALVAEMFSDKENGPKEEARKGEQEALERKGDDCAPQATCGTAFDGPAPAGIVGGTGSKPEEEETKSPKNSEMVTSRSELGTSTWLRSSTRVVNGAGASALRRTGRDRSPVRLTTAVAAVAAEGVVVGGADTARGEEKTCEGGETIADRGAMEVEGEGDAAKEEEGSEGGRREAHEGDEPRIGGELQINMAAAGVVGGSVPAREVSSRSAAVSQRRKRTVVSSVEAERAAAEPAALVSEGVSEQIRCRARGVSVSENGIACCDPSMEGGSKCAAAAAKSESGGEEKRSLRSGAEEVGEDSRGGVAVAGGRQKRGGGGVSGGGRSGSREGSRVGAGGGAETSASTVVRQAPAAATVGASGGRGLLHNAVGKGGGATCSAIDGFSLLAAAASEHLRSNGNEGGTWSGVEGQRVMPRACAAVPRSGGGIGSSSSRANGYVSAERRLNAVFNRSGSSSFKGIGGGGGGAEDSESRGVGREGEAAVAGSGGTTVLAAGGRRSSVGGRGGESAVTAGREKGSHPAMSVGLAGGGERNQQSNGTKRRKERRGNVALLGAGSVITAGQEELKSDASLENEVEATAAHSHNEPRGSQDGGRGGSLGSGGSGRVATATVPGSNGGAVCGPKRGGGGVSTKKMNGRGGGGVGNGRIDNSATAGRPLGGGGGASQAQLWNREAEIKKRLIARTGDVAAQPAKRREVNRNGEKQRTAESSEEDDEATEDDDVAPTAGAAEGGSLGNNNVRRGGRAVMGNGRHVEFDEGGEAMDPDEADNLLAKQQDEEGIAAPRRDPSLAEYDVGDVVWAKSGQKHDPFWPARVVDPLQDAPASVRQRGQAQRLCVMYYGPTANRRRDREQEEQGEKNGTACESCGVALLPTLTGKSKKQNPEDGRFCRSCLKFIQAKQHCGVCKKIWLPNTKGNYVQCDQCKFWIHNECDFYIKKHFKLTFMEDGGAIGLAFNSGSVTQAQKTGTRDLASLMKGGSEGNSVWRFHATRPALQCREDTKSRCPLPRFFFQPPHSVLFPTSPWAAMERCDGRGRINDGGGRRKREKDIWGMWHACAHKSKGGRKREDEEGEACLGRSKQRRQHEEQQGRGGTMKKRRSEGTMRMEERGGGWNERRKRDEKEEDDKHGRRREFMEEGRGCREEVARGRRTLRKGEEEVGTRGMRRSHEGDEEVGQGGGGCARGKQTLRQGGGGGRKRASACQLEQRLDHILAMIGDINTFAAPATISERLITLKIEIRPLQQPLATDGNIGAPRQYKMPTFRIEKFDDYTSRIQSSGGSPLQRRPADLHTKISWEDLTKEWKKRFIVDDAPTLAINRLFAMSEGNTMTCYWLTEWQKIEATPHLDSHFRICAASSTTVLEQDGDDWHPVEYFSHKVPPINSLDVARKKELLVFMTALKQWLRFLLKDWVDRLPNIEFTYNTSLHPTIGVTPFELHHGGRKGLIFADLLLPRIADFDAPCSPAFVRKYRDLLAKACMNMQKAQVHMQQQANQRRVPCPIRAGDLVSVFAEEFALEQDISCKLLPKWFGPSTVTSAAGDEPDGPSFVVGIPPHLPVHPIFHASKLATYTPAKSDDFPGRRSQDPPSMDGHQEVDRVITDRKYGSKPRQYKVAFKACDGDDTRWISRADLQASGPLIYAHYERQRLAKKASRPAHPTWTLVPPSDRQLCPRSEKTWFRGDTHMKGMPAHGREVPYEPIVMRWTVERCAVCWQVDEYDVNKIIVCDRCHVAVHEECYGTKAMDKKGPWVCRLCETPDIERECCLCPVRGGAMKPTSVGGLWAHLLCAWWTPNVCIEDTRKMEPIEGLTDVNIAYFKMTCSICKQPHGACIQCDLRGCCVSYHPMCARRCGYFMEMKPRTKDGMFVKMEMTSFCAKHRTPHPDSAGMETMHPESLKPKSRASGGDRRRGGVGGAWGDVYTDDEEHSSNEGGGDDSKGFSAARCTPYETDAARRASRKQASRRQPVPYRVRGISWHTVEQIQSLRPGTQNEEEGFSLHARLEIAQKSESRRLCFGQSAIHGWGLMARRAIRNGEIVGEYRGVLVGGVVANMREERYQRQGKHCYVSTHGQNERSSKH
ncbi:hypothetical protein CBR_g18930 [Chara braunii]|uniref:PWWP domain-containing protein n=1 Tax=Chara braunii TaxID=69332 RepID=A0A388KWR9_CHABU|nr:hypothetical protein CBR_g18930 [Chara braunii]|eukprot:GBG74520.1 hypothetical protein CBR_g18930 [Chara braunii]